MDYQPFLEHIEEIAQKAGRDPASVKVIPVTKYHSVDEIRPLYDFGLRSFGESILQEALPKMDVLPQEIQWHYIGTLQKNKAEKVLNRFAWIHAVDNLELAEKIAALIQRGVPSRPLLLQVNASGERSKHGLSIEEWEESFEQLLLLKELDIRGWMTMAPLTEDEQVVRKVFAQTRQFQVRMNELYDLNYQELSMGMSRDYRIAIQEGATMLRIGSAFFA